MSVTQKKAMVIHSRWRIFECNYHVAFCRVAISAAKNPLYY